jgi:hypothetical protein
MPSVDLDHSRHACVLTPRRYRKPLIDVAIADGREIQAGSIRIYQPITRDRGACPMCYLAEQITIRRGEGLLFTAVATTAAFAAHILLRRLVEPSSAANNRGANLIQINFANVSIETLWAQGRRDCSACLDANRVRTT